MDLIQDLNPTTNILHFNRVDKYLGENCDTKVAEFIQHNQSQKKIREELQPKIKTFMFRSHDRIMKKVRRHNLLNSKHLTFDDMLKLADGWPTEDLEILTECIKKGDAVKLTNELLSI